MLPIQYKYPEDRNGTNPECRIVDERHTITPSNGANFNFIIPRAAPYFESSMTVVHVASGEPLTKGIDWEPSYKFEMGSNTAPYLQLYGAISILTTAYDGATLALEYQTLGGPYTLNEEALTTVLANTVIDPRLTSWESVTLKPGIYLPEPHLHNVVDTVGYDDLVAAVRDLIDKFTLESSSLMTVLQTHIDDKQNPHQTNLTKLGIERFQNVYKATETQADVGVDDINYVTIALVRHMLATVPVDFDVTKEDVGLGSVNNWTTATLEEAVNGVSDRYMSSDVFRAALNQVLASLPISQIADIQTALQNHIANSDNPHNVTLAQLNIAAADKNVGNEGDVPFYVGSDEALDTVTGQILNAMGVVHNDTELNAQLLYREDFATVFGNWKRIAFLEGNSNYDPDDLQGWSYNSADSAVNSTISSNTYIGLLDPVKLVGDYELSVTVSSTSTGDDFIGLCLGVVPDGESQKALFLLRGGQHPDAGSATDATGTLDLVLVTSGGVDYIQSIGDLTSYPDGWAGYDALGRVPVRAARVGNVLTLQTGDANGALTYTMTVDLSTDDRLEDFAGPVNLGYGAYGQADSTWITLARTGANPPIYTTHNGRVYEWVGSAYVESSKTPEALLPRGRYYRNPVTKRQYYTLAAGSPTLIAGDSVIKDYSKATVVLDRVAHVDSNGRLNLGSFVDHWSQHPTTGTMTYRGHTAKLDELSYDIRSRGTGVNSTLWLGDDVKRHAGVQARNDGSIGFTLASGNRPMYLDATGVIQHSGMNRTSDSRMKNIIDEIDYDNVDVSSLKLYLYQWKRDERISETLWDKEEIGPLAQEIQKVFPSCVTTNPTTGLLTIDDAKLATILSIVALKRLEKLNK